MALGSWPGPAGGQGAEPSEAHGFLGIKIMVREAY